MKGSVCLSSTFLFKLLYHTQRNGEPKLSIVTNPQDYSLSEDHKDYLGDILEKVYIYSLPYRT